MLETSILRCSGPPVKRDCTIAISFLCSSSIIRLVCYSTRKSCSDPTLLYIRRSHCARKNTDMGGLAGAAAVNEFWTVEGSAVLFYGVIMEVMIPAHLHLETACLEGILHFSGPAFRGRGARGDWPRGVQRTPRSLLDSGGRQGNEGRWAGASACRSRRAMEQESGAQALPRQEARPWKRGLGSFRAARLLQRMAWTCGTPRGELAIGNRRPGRVGLRGSGEGVYTTPPGPSRPPPTAASRCHQILAMMLWKSSTKNNQLQIIFCKLYLTFSERL